MDSNFIRTEVNHRTNPLPRHPLIKAAAAPVRESDKSFDPRFLSVDNLYARRDEGDAFDNEQ